MYPLVAESLPCTQDDRLSANSTTCRPCLFQNVTCFLYLKCQERCSPRIPKISHYYNIDIKPPIDVSNTSVKVICPATVQQKGQHVIREKERERYQGRQNHYLNIS